MDATTHGPVDALDATRDQLIQALDQGDSSRALSLAADLRGAEGISELIQRSEAIGYHPNGTAPLDAGKYKLGAKGGRMAAAWQYVWDRLDRTEYKGALELAQSAAQAFDLKPVSVSEMLCRMRAAGVIEQEMIAAPTTYERVGKHGVPMPFTANRRRVHYRIAADKEAG